MKKRSGALEHLKISYVEERHLPGFHRLATQKVGGSSVPVLVTETSTLTDSSDILSYLDSISSADTKLYPTAPELRCEVDQLEQLFNTELGPSTRCWVYFYLLSDWKLMQKLWCNGTPWFERIWFPVVFPRARRFVHKTYNVTPTTAAESYNRIQQIFEMVGDRLADGRKYIVGDCFSAADLSFASFAAPNIFPAEYGVKLPQLHEIPRQMASQIQSLRDTPAGKYVLRLYREQRRIQQFQNPNAR